MLRCINDMKGHAIHAIDGHIGQVSNFFIDDRYWMIRYLIVDVGNWLHHKEVLISPDVLQRPGEYEQPINLTKEQIEKSPIVDTEKPVSLQEEEKLRSHYDWPIYWFADPMFGYMPPELLKEMSNEKSSKDTNSESNKGDSHLRSVKEITGYSVEAVDGVIGHIDEFILDTDTWKIRYLVVKTHEGINSHKVLLAPTWLKKISWQDKKIQLPLTMEMVRNCPEFDPNDPVNREYEEVLYDYYGHQKYW